jgi:hypothetical protein
MIHLKYLFIFVFALVALVAVGYANSEPKATDGILIYDNGFSLVGGCRLKVKISGSEIIYIPASESKTEFHGFWPARAEEPVEMANGDRGVVLTGSERTPEETLDVKFTVTADGLQPVGFVYKNLRLQRIDGSLGYHLCSGLRRVR